VATEPIAQWARGYSSHVTVVPMALDLAVYEPAAGRANSSIVLGWAGTAGGVRYLESLAPVLRTVGERHGFSVRVVSGGYQQVRLAGVPLQAQPWRGIDQLRGFDIGLLPLDDSPFERAKFPFKLLQYWALGLPVVALRVGLAAEVIEDGVNGLLASSHDQWQAALCALIADPVLRRRLGDAGRETVASHYTIERVGPLLVEGLLEAAAR
jgi:glycosyltransferase involved in cell wall biosynthesis